MRASRLLLLVPALLAGSLVSPLHAAEKLTYYCSG